MQVDVFRDIGEAGQAVFENRSVHELRAFVDELFVKSRAEAHRRRADVLPLGERRVDREADVADGDELFDVDLSRLLVDSDLDAGADGLPEDRGLREAAGLANV